MDQDELRQAVKDAETKRVIKEAIHEWLNDKFAQLGQWSLGGAGAAILALIAYFLLIKGGWTPPG